MKGIGFFREKSQTWETLTYFQISSGLWMNYPFSVKINLKMHAMIFIAMSWMELKKENKDPCKPLLLDFPMEVDDRKFTKSYLIKEIPSPFILIACPIWTSVYHLKYFMLRSVQKFYILIGQK